MRTFAFQEALLASWFSPFHQAVPFATFGLPNAQHKLQLPVAMAILGPRNSGITMLASQGRPWSHGPWKVRRQWVFLSNWIVVNILLGGTRVVGKSSKNHQDKIWDRLHEKGNVWKGRVRYHIQLLGYVQISNVFTNRGKQVVDTTKRYGSL